MQRTLCSFNALIAGPDLSFRSQSALQWDRRARLNQIRDGSLYSQRYRMWYAVDTSSKVSGTRESDTLFSRSQRDQILLQLRNVSIFRDIADHETLGMIATKCVLRSYEDGEHIVTEVSQCISVSDLYNKSATELIRGSSSCPWYLQGVCAHCNRDQSLHHFLERLPQPCISV